MGIPEGYEAIPIDWCGLCCDGKLPCVCEEPAFYWQAVASETEQEAIVRRGCTADDPARCGKPVVAQHPEHNSHGESNFCLEHERVHLAHCRARHCKGDVAGIFKISLP